MLSQWLFLESLCLAESQNAHLYLKLFSAHFALFSFLPSPFPCPFFPETKSHVAQAGSHCLYIWYDLELLILFASISPVLGLQAQATVASFCGTGNQTQVISLPPELHLQPSSLPCSHNRVMLGPPQQSWVLCKSSAHSFSSHTLLVFYLLFLRLVFQRTRNFLFSLDWLASQPQGSS